MNQQASLFDTLTISRPLTVPYAPHSATSRAVAEKIKPRVQNDRARVLALFRTGKTFTADEVADALGGDVLTYRPRVTDCRNAGLIMETKEARPNSRGNRCAVLRLATRDEMAAALSRHELEDTKQAQALAAWVRAEMEAR